MVPFTRVFIVALLVTLVAAAGCRRQPRVADADYREAVVAFHTGLAAMQTSQEVLAREQLDRVIELVPHEPAAWANLGLLLLRQQEIDPAIERLTQAEALAPGDAGIQRLQALAAGRRGDLPAAVRHWTRALEIEPHDPRAAYALAMDLEREGGPENEARAQQTLDALARRTGNLVVQVAFARLAAKRDDGPALQRALAGLDEWMRSAPEDVRERFEAVQEAGRTGARAAGLPMAFLHNVLLRLPEYRHALALVSTPREEVGEPIAQFLVLPNPTAHAAPPDESLAFAVRVVDALQELRGWAGTVPLTGEGAPLVGGFDGQTLRLVPAGGGETVTTALAARNPAPAAGGRPGVLAVDLNYDYRTDLVTTGPHGIRFLQQTADGGFADVTAATTLPPGVLSRPVWGAWAADVDTDGDLDVVIGFADGPPQVLRNNGDMTFTAIQPFGDVRPVRSFVWADVDGEGVPDAALLQDDGTVRVLLNARGGSFFERPLPEGFPRAVAIAAAEASGDAVLDLLALTAEGAVVRLSKAEDGAGWTQAELARAHPPGALSVEDAGLIVTDLDNNGAVDLVVTAAGWSQVLLGAPDGTFRALRDPVELHARAAADVSGDGRVELIGAAPDGRAAIASSRGEKQYHWQALRPRAATAFGDQRINSFGIGGEVEVRTGLHVQKRPIASPVVHVGLGEATQAEVVRIMWPNGTLQSEFSLAADAEVAAEQRLKGSCPWLFAWDGQEMRFVTDLLWRSPLGLAINAQETADVLMTEDRVRIRGDQLAPRHGVYDLRITAELWETHFFDLVSLLVVDHPEGTEIWQDERFAVPPPANAIVVTGPVQPLASVRDDQGRDVSDLVSARDDRHLDFAGRGAYQGVTRDHFVELELPASVPRSDPVWIIAQGWVHPTDSSINVAISQGSHPAPRGLEMQVANGAGRFRTVETDLGFPAGKDKTILIDVTRHLPPAGPVRIRLATNMEIYWDRLGWAVGRPDVPLQPVRLAPRTAELRYRGYSVTEQPDRSTPERPRYVLEGTMPRWRDLEGYHTRFGDVRALLLEVDDRYVIMNAGDELRLEFPEVPPAAPGHVRTFVLISDGWEKDGDFNTTFSRTVLPLPTHDSGRYDRPPGRLEDDPVYLKHPQDFETYHTRYVTPDRVRDALRPPARHLPR